MVLAKEGIPLEEEDHILNNLILKNFFHVESLGLFVLLSLTLLPNVIYNDLRNMVPGDEK